MATNIAERKPGERKELILKVLKERGHPMPARSIWHQLRTKDVQITLKNVEQCLYAMRAKGAIVSEGAHGSMVYSLPVEEKPMQANGTHKPVTSEPTAIIQPRPSALAEPPAAPVQIAGIPRALRVGSYTISQSAWIVSDDHGTWIELLTTALEIDNNTRHPRTKKLRFEQADEIRRVRAWLADQTGEPLIPDTAAIERDRDAALALAEAAEQRARAAEQRADRAETQLASIKAAIG